MSHDNGHTTDKPNMPSSAAFAAFAIFAGLIIAAFSFIKSMSHSGTHDSPHAASATHGSAVTHDASPSHNASSTQSDKHHTDSARTEAPKEEAHH